MHVFGLYFLLVLLRLDICTKVLISNLKACLPKRHTLRQDLPLARRHQNHKLPEIHSCDIASHTITHTEPMLKRGEQLDQRFRSAASYRAITCQMDRSTDSGSRIDRVQGQVRRILCESQMPKLVSSRSRIRAHNILNMSYIWYLNQRLHLRRSASQRPPVRRLFETETRLGKRGHHCQRQNSTSRLCPKERGQN